MRVELHSLSNNRSRHRSSRHHSERRSKAVAHDICNHTSSKKRHRRVRAEDVSPMKSFPIRDEASAGEAMVAESQVSSSLKKQRSHNQNFWMPPAGSIPFPV